MRFFEKQIPQSERQLVAGYIDSAAAACPVRQNYYTRAKLVGMIDALVVIESHKDHQPETLALLREKLNAIGEALVQKANPSGVG